VFSMQLISLRKRYRFFTLAFRGPSFSPFFSSFLKEKKNFTSIPSIEQKITMDINKSSKKRKTELSNSLKEDSADAQRVRNLEEQLLQSQKECANAKTELLKCKKRITYLESNANSLGVSNDNNSDDEESVADVSDFWQAKYNELREHRIVYGNCTVSQKGPNPKLGNWILNQKKAYKNKKLTLERVVKLDSLGLVWSKSSPPPICWDERFQELTKFQKAFGHCNMTINTSSPSEMAKWISNQRVEYRRYSKGRDSLLSLEQIGQLNGIGFDWKGHRLS